MYEEGSPADIRSTRKGEHRATLGDWHGALFIGETSHPAILPRRVNTVLLLALPVALLCLSGKLGEMISGALTTLNTKPHTVGPSQTDQTFRDSGIQGMSPAAFL